MDISHYENQRDRVIHSMRSTAIPFDNEQWYGQYMMMSANLSNYLPGIDPAKHAGLFNQLHIHKRLSKMEQGSKEALSFLTTENMDEERLADLKQSPVIFCTFHTGSYRLINTFLIRQQVPYTLVAASSILAAEGDDYISIHQSLQDTASEKLTVIDAEHAFSGLQMLRELKKGKSLLLYIDGNTGAGGDTQANDNHSIVDFLEQQVYARKGIGYLAYTANVPILPVTCYRPSWNDIRIQFHHPVTPHSTEGKNAFAVRATQQLYHLLEPVVKQYPEQWEAWLYLQKVACINKPAGNDSVKRNSDMLQFNLRRFALFSMNQEPFLMEKAFYTSYRIEASLFHQLRKSMDDPIHKNCFDEDTLHEFEKMGVLCYI